MDNNKVFEIFINIYESKTSNYIDSNKKNYNIFFDEEHINTKMLHRFFEKSKDYSSNILNNFITYSILYGLEDNINLINKYKNKLNYFPTLPDDILRIILYINIKFILLEKRKIIKKEETLNAREKNLKLYSYIKKDIYLFTLTSLIKKILLSIKKELNIEIDSKFIKALLNTSKYDELIIKYSLSQIENTDDVLKFKIYFFRIFLFENYIYESYKKLITLDNINKDKPFNISIELLNECSTTPILFYIEKCISTNSFKLTEDDFLLNVMVENFINFNNMSNNFDKIIRENEKKLRKIYPIYILDN